MLAIRQLIPTQSAVVLDKDMLNKWDSARDILEKNYIDRTLTIDIATAAKYRFDLAGLFKYSGIHQRFIYPHILVNGYNSSLEYDGNILEFKLINEQKLQELYSHFSKKKTETI